MRDREKTIKVKPDLLAIENGLHRAGFQFICGVDEAGRGPLAGPVCAAAVILPQDLMPEGLNDSKKLSEKQRERLFPLIQDMAVSYSIAYATVEEIEEHNILQAAMLAMRRAVSGLSVVPELALIDGNRCPELSMESRAVIGGDGKCASIAAASILAKVSRDHLMLKLAEKYPQYGFERHKGYGTKAHYEAIREYGPCPIHRISFLKSMKT